MLTYSWIKKFKYLVWAEYIIFFSLGNVQSYTYQCNTEYFQKKMPIKKNSKQDINKSKQNNTVLKPPSAL